jgi:hypothetical protein
MMGKKIILYKNKIRVKLFGKNKCFFPLNLKFFVIKLKNFQVGNANRRRDKEKNIFYST